MDDRYFDTPGAGQDYYDREPEGYGRDYASGRGYSSARDYAAAGRLPRGRERYGARENYGGGGYDRGQSRYTGSYWSDGHRTTDEQRDWRGERSDRDRNENRGWAPDRRPWRGDDRGFMERAGDEVRSWFGDEDASRRRELDQRYDERQGRSERASRRYGHDDNYHHWRRTRMEELDRDYDEYRQENALRFENEFNSWRTERQGQRTSLQRVEEHMEVVGSDGGHVGTVDKVRGDRIILTKNDADAGGHHHSIPSRWIQSVDDKVTIRKTADEAKSHWRDEDRSGAMFGGGDTGEDRGRTNLNRSFSGTY